MGIIIGWLTVGIVFATMESTGWTDWQKARIITLLETIAENTDFEHR
jgi:hypothetical protein